MPHPLVAVFQRYADSGDKHAFDLVDGTSCMGWVMDVRGSELLFMWAPSPFYQQATGSSEDSPPDEWIAFDRIALRSLSYWDPASKAWVDFEIDRE